MARTAPVPHLGFPTLRRASRGTAVGPLLYGLSVIGSAALRVVAPAAKGFYSGLVESQQRRADRLVRELAQSHPHLKIEPISSRDGHPPMAREDVSS